MNSLNIRYRLFLIFLKIGAFTFGGGYALISMIRHEIVEKKKWCTHDEFMRITTIAESTPGPISINCATYVGYQQAGFLGAVFATVGLIIPSFVIICFISLFFINMMEITIIANAFRGVKIAVGVLIFNMAIKLFQKMRKKLMSVIIMLCVLIISLFINFFSLNVSTIYLILISGLTGYLVFIIKKCGNDGEAK